MTMSELASAIAGRAAGCVQRGIGKALGDRRMIEEGLAMQRRAQAQYDRAVERERYVALLHGNDDSEIAS